MPSGVGTTPGIQRILQALEGFFTRHGYHYDATALNYYATQISEGHMDYQSALNHAAANGDAWKANQGGQGPSGNPANQPGGGTGGSPPGGNPPAPPGSPSGGSGSSSSGGSSSGGSAPAPPNYAQYVASYLSLVRSWDLKVSKNIQNLIQNAAHAKLAGQPSPWSMDQFMNALRHTQEYHDRFAGIQRFPGMTEASYLSQEQSYQSAADTAHIDINKKKIEYLFKNGVSVAEFQDRAQAYQVLNTNKAYFDQFKEQLKLMGKHVPSQKQLFDWVMSKGQSNKEWTRIWQDASVRYTADQAGIDFKNHARNVTSDLELGPKEVNKIANKIAAGSATNALTGAPGSFQDLAKQLKTVMPLSRAASWGITKKDLVELEFGGSRQAAIADKVQSILDKLNNTDNATPYSSTSGIGQRSQSLRNG